MSSHIVTYRFVNDTLNEDFRYYFSYLFCSSRRISRRNWRRWVLPCMDFRRWLSTFPMRISSILSERNDRSSKNALLVRCRRPIFLDTFALSDPRARASFVANISDDSETVWADHRCPRPSHPLIDTAITPPGPFCSPSETTHRICVSLRVSRVYDQRVHRPIALIWFLHSETTISTRLCNYGNRGNCGEKPTLSSAPEIPLAIGRSAFHISPVETSLACLDFGGLQAKFFGSSGIVAAPIVRLLS